MPSSACSTSVRERGGQPSGSAGQVHPYAAVDVVVFTIDGGRLKTLLVKVRDGPLAGHWAFPGGFVGLDESPDGAALHELRQNAGVHNVYLEQLWPADRRES